MLVEVANLERQEEIDRKLGKIHGKMARASQPLRPAANSGHFLLLPPPPLIYIQPLAILNIRNNKQCSVLTHARVNFSQSEMSSLLRGRGGGG